LAELFRSVQDLVAVLERPKRLVTPCSWVNAGKNGQRGLKLKAALRDDYATIGGVTLELGCHVEGFHLPSRVVMMAEIGNKPRAMARIDINGSRHENRYAICGEWQFLDAGMTHFHDTRLHLGIAFSELFDGTYGDLPVARPIDNISENFLVALEKCGELLNIDNLGEIEEPQWQPRQFPL